MELADTELSPSQQMGYEGLQSMWELGNVFMLWGATGSGKSTVARKLAADCDACYLTLANFMDRLEEVHPLKLEEVFYRLTLDGLRDHETVVIDDADLLDQIGGGCGSYPRAGLFDGALTALAAYAAESGKKMLLVCSAPPSILRDKCWPHGIQGFEAQDYGFFMERFLGQEHLAGIDVNKVYRFAPNLSARQLASACTYLKTQPKLDTEGFVDYLRSQHMTSNVHLQEVRPAALGDLRGVEDVIEKLEANIILPLENDELATELALRPKRGVLLVGPPGTGKTTIGRALAHRLKSKFFLIDGTFISGTSQFYGAIHHIFRTAKENAPSIIFIDDTDAIFESGEELGLYRYLLTMLDGLESESQGHVCVMMTAMDVAHLPPALIRSGRIELWLEMQLPNEEARREILSKRCQALPESIRPGSVDEVVAVTEEFTGADLVRLVDDAKTLLAFDRSKGLETCSFESYLVKAVEGVRSNKEKYAEAEGKARGRSSGPGFPSYMNPFDFDTHVITHMSSGTAYDGQD